MHSYTCAYSVAATNVSVATLGTAWAAIPPPDDGIIAALGLTLSSDMVTNAGGIVTRTIVYDAATPGPLGDPNTRDALQNLYTESFSRALSTRVTAAPVVYA